MTDPGHASTFEIFGNTPRDIGMGGAMTAAARGYSALFYNPGAMTVGHEQRLGMGLTLTVPSLFVDRERPDGDRPTALPDTHIGLALGWVKAVGGIFEKKLAIGASLYVPLDQLLRVQGIDPQSPQFYLYQNLQDKLILDLGIAYEAAEWLSLGVAVQILADLGGSSTLRLDLANSAFDQREFGVTVLPSASLIAGIHIRPTPTLSVGLTYRGANALDFTLPVVVSEGESLQLVLDVAQTVLWTPDEFALGVSFYLEDARLRLALDATYARWSAAPDPSPRLSVDIGGRLLESFGLQDALDLSTRAKRIDLGFSDTLTPRVGAEWETNRWLTLRAGYFFRPTPAPRQTSATAYLDNDAHVISVGAGFEAVSPAHDNGESVQIDIAAQVTVLPRRTVDRTDPNDPVGDISHGGAIWTLAAHISHRY